MARRVSGSDPKAAELAQTSHAVGSTVDEFYTIIDAKQEIRLYG